MYRSVSKDSKGGGEGRERERGAVASREKLLNRTGWQQKTQGREERKREREKRQDVCTEHGEVN